MRRLYPETRVVLQDQVLQAVQQGQETRRVLWDQPLLVHH